MDRAVEERIRAAYAAFADGDVETVLAHLSPDVRMVNPAYAVESGMREGLPTLRAAVDGLHDGFLDLSIEVEQILEGPDGVVVTSRWRGSGRVSGAPVDETLTHVFEL
ncbi:MAG TPA: nuclear transport factor 2 family protein, partial [Thermoleophilaceae bacterium]|nr:nuclear transport factor 2 family protein [Thermoleophilaceae bacterium]